MAMGGSIALWLCPRWHRRELWLSAHVWLHQKQSSVLIECKSLELLQETREIPSHL